jgi:glycosyltransferase involved in cell wall biosynthesis
MEQVSCLMVTDARFDFFRRSVTSFLKQDYAKKELIVVSAGSREYQAAIASYIKQLDLDNVFTVFPSGRCSLGRLRNLALENASGAIVCQWDDDDLSHPSRVRVQMEAMLRSRAEACFLFDHFHLFCNEQHLYWCDWSRCEGNIGLPGTLVAYKSAVPRYKDSLMQFEDTVAQQEICNQGTRIAVMSGYGHLYMYTYHGKNISGWTHHARLAKKFGMEAATLEQRKPLIRSALSDYEIEKPVSVRDHMSREVFCSPEEVTNRPNVALENGNVWCKTFVYAAQVKRPIGRAIGSFDDNAGISENRVLYPNQTA